MSERNEMEEIKRRYIENLRKEAESQLNLNNVEIAKFIEYCNALGIKVGTEQVSYLQTIGIVANHKGLLDSLCQDLLKDKDGLYDIHQLKALFQPMPFPGTGLLKSANYAIMAHQFYRRGMNPTANWEPKFIELFWKLDLPNSDVRIALDPDRVKLDLNGFGYMEFDTWFGAAFNKDISEIKDGLAELRPPSYLDSFEINFLFGSAYSLHIKWSTEGTVKTFQAEAYLDESVITEWEDDIWHPVRYIHAEYDLTKRNFKHFDGAIHFYPPHDYKVMRDKDLNYNLKNTTHIKAPTKKIFCLNNDIPVDLWLEFTCHFFPHNPLIIEYFEGKYPDHLQETLNAIQKSKLEEN